MWGEQVDEKVASEMLDIAFDEFGVNFIDTSELYPMPASSETYGAADAIIKKWLEGRDRSEVILATKMAGFSDNIDWLRPNSGGQGTRVSKAQIKESVESNLGRLGTDYIDLFQIEWPDRYTQLHAMSVFDPNDVREDDISFLEQLEALGELVEQGKVRHVGLSNETPYGLLKFIEASGGGLPVVASIQNAYNLLERNTFETGLLETCHYTKTSLLAHSPMAGGVLSGKYSDGSADAESRLLKYPGYTARYLLPSAQEAVAAYASVAEKYGLTPAQLALSWCYSRSFVTSTIIGATSTEQLRDNLMALNCPLTTEMEADIFELYANQFRDPTKGIALV